MSKFTKVYKKWHVKNNGKYDSAHEYHKALMHKFGDWQPPKPLVVVPQFVADWFEINKRDIDGNIKDLARMLKDNPKSDWTEMDNWFMKSSNKPIETLILMRLEGYTVKQEQMFYLREKNTWYYLTKSKKHSFLKLVNNPYFDEDNEFTQSEIDKLNVGSYEQIPVKVDEVEG